MRRFILTLFIFLFSSVMTSAETSLIGAEIEKDDNHNIVLSIKDGEQTRTVMIKEYYSGPGSQYLNGYTFEYNLLDFQGDLDSGYVIMDYICSFWGPVHHLKLLVYTKEGAKVECHELFDYIGWHYYVPNWHGDLLHVSLQDNTILAVLKSQGVSSSKEDKTQKISIFRFAIQGNHVTKVLNYTITEHDLLLQDYLDIFSPNFYYDFDLAEKIDISTPESTFDVSAKVNGPLTIVNFNLMDEELKLIIDTAVRTTPATISLLVL